MAQLSESQLATIGDHPIGDALNSWRDAFAPNCPRVDLRGATSRFEQLVAEPYGRDLALKLIAALLSLPAASKLLSDDGLSPLSIAVALSYARLSSNQTDIKHTAHLVKHVVAGKDDPTIWTTVYDLIRQTQPVPLFPPPTAPASTARPITPQRTPSATPSFQQTPWSFKSSGLVSTTETRTEVDPLLKFEVEQNLIIDHPGVFDAYFGRVAQLASVAAAVFDACREADPPMYTDGAGWTDWPLNCKEDEVLGFLRRHIEQFLSFADDRGFRPSKRRQCVTAPNQPPSGSVAKRKPDIGITCSEQPEEEEGRYHWSHILVPGELKTNPAEDNYNSTWLQISRYAREVFAAQDTRRFVLGFTLCGPLMRLWEFDRLGVVASKSFDINKDGHRFVLAILGYLWMSEEELGFDPTIMEDDGRYMKIQRNNRTERIHIDKLMKRQRSIASRATTCWIGRVENKSGDQLVIKDSWEYEERPEEGRLLKEATKAGVQNVTRYYYHETVRIEGAMDDVRKNVRKGLSDEEGRNPRRQPRPLVSSAVTSSSSGLGRGRGGSRGRSRSRSRGGSASRKRPSSSLDGSMPPPPPKRSCSDLTVKDGIRRRNRVHRRVIMRDIGKSLYEASSPRAMLTGLLGGLKGHESLFNAKILHRDISIGNVLLNEVEDDGFLIDLDLAVKTDREKASGAPCKTGTKVFMAIGVLYGEEHSFMHDLESFFWLLFWICVHWNGPDQQLSGSEYDSWNSKNTRELAREKAGLVLKENMFNTEVDENFTPYCRPLVPCIENLRSRIFPNGKSWDNGEEENRDLYSQMKAALEEARQELNVIE